jgi:hypothetical protein
MRKNQIITIVAATFVVLATKVFFLSAPTNANAITKAGIDASNLHQSIKDIPVQTMHDMTFVFSDAD